jgi:hypothetical protein
MDRGEDVLGLLQAIGRDPALESALTRRALERVRDLDFINRRLPHEWDTLTVGMSAASLADLVRGLTIAERQPLMNTRGADRRATEPQVPLYTPPRASTLSRLT